MKASDLFVACLLEEGVEYIFALPGEENLDLLESLRKSTIHVIVVRNEQSAAFMAATYGRLTGKAGVVLTTLGPGATNSLTGVAYAHMGGMPLVIITGQKPVKQSKQAKFQVVDIVSMMRPVTKSSHSVASIHRIPEMIRSAFKQAQMEKPGAVHIELPEDIAGEQLDQQKHTDLTPLHVSRQRRPIADKWILKKMAKKLQQASRPIVLVGAGTNRTRISSVLTRFVQQYNIPFFSSQMGKGVISELLPQCLGTAALTDNDYIHQCIAMADLVIAIGHDTREKPTHMQYCKEDIIHVDFVPAQVDGMYHPSLEVIGDIAHTFAWLLKQSLDTSGRDHSAIYKQNEANKQQLQHNAAQHRREDIMTPGELIGTLQKNYQDNSILCLDNGLYKVWFARNYQSTHPNTLLLDNALATMGAGYCSGMVAAMLHPEKHIICITGDGGLLMNLGDLQTAARLGCTMTIIVLNDSAYGMIKRKQQNHGFPSFSLNLDNPDFGQLAKAFGLHYHTIQQPDEFEDTLATCVNESGVSLLEVPFSYPDVIA